MVKKNRKLAFVIGIVLAVLLATHASAATFDNLYVIGDSTAVPSAFGGSGLANSSQINMDTILSVNYLFLPAHLNLDDLTLYFDVVAPSTTFTATTTMVGGGAPVNVVPGVPADIGSLFTSVAAPADYKYSVTLTSDNGVVLNFFIMKAENLPTLYVTTSSGSWANIYTSSLHPSSTTYHSRYSAPEIGTLCLINADGTVAYNGALDYVKGRAHGSWTASGFTPGYRKPFDIKFPTPFSLIPGSGAATEWAITSNHSVDDSLLHYYLALKLNESTSVSRSPVKVAHANVYSNGRYLGFYQLQELYEISPERVNIVDQTPFITDGAATTYATETAAGDPAIDAGIVSYRYWPTATTTSTDITGGYLMQMLYYYQGEAMSGFITSRTAARPMYNAAAPEYGTGIRIHSPNHATKDQVQYIAQYVQEFENALRSPTSYNALGKHYSEYVDVDSLAGYMNLFCITMDWDHMYNNTFLYKPAGEKIQFGPAWDFDRSFENRPANIARFFYQNASADLWKEDLVTKGDFMQTMYDVNKSDYSPAFRKMMGYAGPASSMESLQSVHDRVVASTTMNHTRWDGLITSPVAGGTITGSWSSHYTVLENWVQARFEYWEGENGKVGVWDNSYLRGATVTESGGVLTANITGTASAYQWYKIDPGVSWMVGTAIPGETNPTYTPAVGSSGVYYVIATGKGDINADYSLPATVGAISLTSNAIDCRGGAFVFDGNGNTSGTAPAGGSYTFGQTITIPGEGTLEKAGHTFAGWNTMPDGSGTSYAAGSSFNVVAGMTLYAQWTPIGGGGGIGGGGSGSGSGTSTANASFIQMPAQSNDYTAAASADYSKFIGVSVDDVRLGSNQYTAWEGSTYVRLYQSFIDTLSTGLHTLTLHYTDGDISGQFQVTRNNSLIGFVSYPYIAPTTTPVMEIVNEVVEEGMSEEDVIY